MSEKKSGSYSKRQKLLIVAALILFIFIAFAGWLFAKADLKQMSQAYTFLDEDRRIENFRHPEKVFPVRRIQRSGPAFQFPEGIRELNETYEFKGEARNMDDFLKKTITTSFLVIKDDKIVSERYFLGATRETTHTSMSVAKSFVSALVGIAIDDGLIESVDRPVSDYVPKLKGSGYDGVAIKHVLQMSSGVKFDEEYDNLFSDINLMFYEIFGLGQPIDDYMANLTTEFPPGQTSYYRSCDTQALGMLISTVTGKPVAEYLEEKIWSKIGMEYDASWCTDPNGIELAFGFLNATPRDFAKFGALYLHNGNWNGEQIVSEEWVRESVTPDNPNLLPGPKGEEFDTFGDYGYQYQWWIPDNPDGDYMAIGVWGQYIYVYPKENLVVVKTSIDPDFGANNYEHDDETVAVCRSIATHLSGGNPED
jgi:CubicO group peptidase (beta-lactamase class C family)